MNSLILTLLGVAGSLLVVAAFFLNQVGRLASSDWRFPAANLAGAVAILASLFEAWNLPSVVMEIFWAAISLYGLLRAAGRKSRSTPSHAPEA